MKTLVAMFRKHGTLQIFMLLGPSLIVVVIFLILPMLIVLKYSFAGTDTYGSVVPGFSLENYRALLRPLYVPIFINSFKLAFYSTLLSLCMAYPVAYFIAFRAKRYSSLLLLLMIIPFWTNFLVRMSAWLVLMNRNGLINIALQTMHVTDEPVKIIGTYGAVLVGLLYVFLPSAVFPIYAAMDSIDSSLLEAARDLGATPLRSFLAVTLPLSLPGVVVATLFVFVPSIGVFIIPAILGGGKSIMIGNLIATLYLEFRNIPFGSAVSVVLLGFVLIGIAFYTRALRASEELRQ